MAYHETQQMVYGEDAVEAMLAGLEVSLLQGSGVSCKCRFIKDDGVTIDPSTTVADLDEHEADFTGYVTGGSTLTFVGEVNLSTSKRAMISTCQVVATEPEEDEDFVSNTLYGYYLVTNGNLVGGESFPAGSEMNIGAPGDFASVDVALPVSLYQDAV